MFDDDHADAMTALGAMAAGPTPTYGGNVVALRGQAARWCSDPVDIDLLGQALEALWTKAFEGQA